MGFPRRSEIRLGVGCEPSGIEDPKSVLIVGASSAIGQATAKILGEAGVEVILASRDGSGKGMDAIPYDPVGGEPPEGLPDRLDGLLYCPGSISLKPFNRTTEKDFLNDYRINVVGAARAVQHALPALKASGSASVVFFNSVAAGTGLGFHASIGAAKAGVEGLARSMAAELAPGIRVNVIAPSLTDTPLAAGLLDSDAKRDAAAARHPLKAVGTPEQMGGLAAFLLGDGGAFCTGQVFAADGGLGGVRTL